MLYTCAFNGKRTCAQGRLQISRHAWTSLWRKRIKTCEVCHLFSAQESFSLCTKRELKAESKRAAALSSPDSPSPLESQQRERTGDARASSAGRSPLSPPRAVQRREGPSRIHKCPVRRRGSRLGSKMSSWVPLLLALLAACLRFGVAEVSWHHSRLANFSRRVLFPLTESYLNSV